MRRCDKMRTEPDLDHIIKPTYRLFPEWCTEGLIINVVLISSPGIIDQDIETPFCPIEKLKEPFNVIVITMIAVDWNPFATTFCDLFGSLFE